MDWSSDEGGEAICSLICGAKGYREEMESFEGKGICRC